MSSIPDSVYFVLSTHEFSRYVLPSTCAAAAGHVPSSIGYVLRMRQTENGKWKEEVRRKDVYVSYEKDVHWMIASMTVMHLRSCHTSCCEVR
jgi:hypothetical protein